MAVMLGFEALQGVLSMRDAMEVVANTAASIESNTIKMGKLINDAGIGGE